MTPEITEHTIQVFLRHMHDRLDQASSIAKAAQVCADGGNFEKAIEIALDVEVLTHEANTLLNAASLVNRLARGCHASMAK